MMGQPTLPGSNGNGVASHDSVGTNRPRAAWRMAPYGCWARGGQIWRSRAGTGHSVYNRVAGATWTAATIRALNANLPDIAVADVVEVAPGFHPQLTPAAAVTSIVLS